MASLNRVSLIGRVAGDVKVTTTTTNAVLVRWAVAVDRPGQSGRTTDYHDVVCFTDEKGGNLLAGSMSKGTLVLCEGRLSTRDWTGTDGATHRTTEVVCPVSGVQFLARSSRTPESVYAGA